MVFLALKIAGVNLRNIKSFPQQQNFNSKLANKNTNKALSFRVVLLQFDRLLYLIVKSRS
jgi:hypothetical protein